MSATPKNIEECAAFGMSSREAAEALGVSPSTVWRRAKLANVVLRDARKDQAHIDRMKKLHADPEFARANRERSRDRMKKLHADPEFAKANSERMKKLNADAKHNPLVLLTDAQRRDYDTFRRNGFSRLEALKCIGRLDVLSIEGSAQHDALY